MRQFMNSRYLRTSSLPLRLTFTWFLVFVLAGYATNFGLLAWKTGLTPTGIAHYYRGYEAALQFPKEMHELLENTHFHIFIVPVVLLVLTHVFYMTAWSERARLWVTWIVWGAALADLAGPWLVRYAGAPFAWWKLASSLSFHGALLFLTVVSLYETWLGRAPDGSPSAVEPADLE